MREQTHSWSRAGDASSTVLALWLPARSCQSLMWLSKFVERDEPGLVRREELTRSFAASIQLRIAPGIKGKSVQPPRVGPVSLWLTQRTGLHLARDSVRQTFSRTHH